MKFTDDTICLKIIDYSETSQIAHLFTREHGKIGVIAKGAKRARSKTAGGLDLFSQGKASIAIRDILSLGQLLEFHETIVHTQLRKSTQTLHAGLFMLEVVSNIFAEGDPHPAAFDLLQNSLIRIQEESSPTLAVLAYFQWRILRHAGLLAGVEYCASCGLEARKFPQDRELYFSSKTGGLLCPSCQLGVREKSPVAPDAFAGLITLWNVERGNRITLDTKCALAVNKLLAYHISYQLGRRLKMIDHIFKQ